MRLTRPDTLPATVETPAYIPADHGVGIVHIGPGAFHRAHQAVYTDTALAASGGDWRIAALSMRSPMAKNQLAPQNGLFSVTSAGPTSQTRVIASIASAATLADDPAAAIAALVDPHIKIASLTITEKGYCLNTARDGIDLTDPDITRDLQDQASVRTLPALLTRALAARRAAGHAPFTVLSCDNLPTNGRLTRRAILSFADAVDPQLADWIDTNTAFPSCMVDRITPARTDQSLSNAAQTLGVQDHAAVTAEPFSQWVIEDDFPTGRPNWEAGGALFVSDVAPYEAMKLRMLNGAHSLIAYAGFVAGHTYVRDAMQDTALKTIAKRHMAAASQTLDPVPGVDLNRYANDLIERFANPAIAHATHQISADGSQKFPQRIFEPATIAAQTGQGITTYAFATAAWCHFLSGDHDIQDPRLNDLPRGGTAPQIVAALHALPGLVPPELAAQTSWSEHLTGYLSKMQSLGMEQTIRDVAKGP